MSAGTLINTVIADQYDAALCTLNTCIERCPDDLWHGLVHKLTYCQVVFHTLIYADLYLGPSWDAVREQPFHRENPQLFRDYEEFEPRKPVQTYEKDEIRPYVAHCRAKVAAVTAAETAEVLAGPSGFDRRGNSRADLHVYNIRHIQHHAAQLTLRLRQHGDIDVPWVGSGWRD